MSTLSPEQAQDPGEPERGQPLLARVNAAYEADNLLLLLILLGEVDPAQVQALASADSLGKYCEGLQEQLSDLEVSLLAEKLGYAHVMGRAVFPWSMESIDRQVRARIADLRGRLLLLKVEGARFRDPDQMQGFVADLVADLQREALQEDLTEGPLETEPAARRAAVGQHRPGGPCKGQKSGPENDLENDPESCHTAAAQNARGRRPCGK